MISYPSLFVAAALCSLSHAAVHSGKAAADWITASGSCEAGKPVRTGVRLVLDEGWHTYWSNPGEGGMKISVAWDLPTGWKAGELEHPVPKRFMTGDLPGFGYEGTVVFPVTMTPPAGFAGEVTLKGKVSWLTCNDSSCIPGNAELELALKEGPPVDSKDAPEIATAVGKIPAPAEGASLAVSEKDGNLVLVISPGKDALEIDGAAVFPETPQVVDAGAKFQFTREGATWTAEVPKSEYASGPLKELTLILAGKNGAKPASVTWKAP